MNLCVDIGNTRVKIGLFQGQKLKQQLVWTDWTVSDLVAFGNREAVQNVMFASVAAHDEGFKNALEANFNTFELNTTTALPFENTYTTPETLGKDRLAAVAGAQALFPGEHCLVIDCGTCIKYDMLRADNVYLGGNIAPGAKMRIQAMHHFTARLPEVAMEMPEDFAGISTKTALQNGALRGACLEIEGFIGLFKKKYSPLRVLLTGGDALFFQTALPEISFNIEAELTLHGLNNILNYNI